MIHRSDKEKFEGSSSSQASINDKSVINKSLLKSFISMNERFEIKKILC